MVGIKTSTIGSTSATKVGTGAKFTINSISASTDTLYLTDVHENLPIHKISTFNSGTRTDSGVNASADSTLVSSEYSGNILKIKQFNHAHHGGNNKIQIVDVFRI